jgi:hypothetical protein
LDEKYTTRRIEPGKREVLWRSWLMSHNIVRSPPTGLSATMEQGVGEMTSGSRIEFQCVVVFELQV